MVNGLGLIIHVVYCVLFYHFTVRRPAVLRQLTFGLVFALVILYLLALVRENSVRGPELEVRVVGSLSSLASVAFCAAPLSTIGVVLRQKSTASVPFPLVLMTFLVTLQWSIFGVCLGDGVITYPNLVGCLVALGQLCLFFVFPNSNKANSLEKSLIAA